MCFKLASRQGCYFQEFVADPHLLPPYALLATVYKPETVPAVLSQCPKLRDPYSEELIQTFPDITVVVAMFGAVYYGGDGEIEDG